MAGTALFYDRRHEGRAALLLLSSSFERVTRARLAGIVALLACLVAVVGVASRARVRGGSAPPLPADFPSLFDLFLGFSALIALAVFGLMFYALWPPGGFRRSDFEPARDPVPMWKRLLYACLPVLLFGGAIAVLARLGHGEGTVSITPLGPPASGHQHAPKTAPAVGVWPFVVVGAIGLAALIVLVVVLVRERRQREAPQVRARKAVAAALDESLDDLERETDARAAVIAAYARMEHALGAAGLARRAWETPLEYLDRTLRWLSGDTSSVHRLTTLFERAKFSPYAVDQQMKTDAIAALRSLREAVS